MCVNIYVCMQCMVLVAVEMYFEKEMFYSYGSNRNVVNGYPS